MRAILVWLATNLIVFGGLAFGDSFLKPSPRRGFVVDPRAGSFANWDGQWYGSIATAGYTYSTTAYSSVTFFPVYPLLGRLVAMVTGMPIAVALFAVANGFWLASLWLLERFIATRPGDAADGSPGHALLALGSVPAGLFLRVNYSESAFLFLVVLFLYAMQRRWPILAVAAVVGVATGARPVGVALVPPLLGYAWDVGPSRVGKWANVALALPVSVLGIGAYAAYLHATFDDALAFVHAQEAWNLRPPTALSERLLALATLEPLRTCFDPRSAAYLGGADCRAMGPFNPRLHDIGFFGIAVALTVLGAARGWLTRCEALTALLLLLVPYLANGYARQMGSMGRFAAVVAPIYLVIARLLGRLPAPAAAGVVAVAAAFLAAHSALFAAWYPIL